MPVLVALVAVGLGIPALGAALVVTDALQPSDAIFVLDGGTPVRELEAASLYRLGYAPRVVVARGRDAISVARQVSGEPSRQERAVRVLRHVGVPEAAVVTLSQEVDNTVQELAADFAFATKQGLRRVILVTSANHTRRVRVIWNSRYERRIPALVYPTSWEAYDARRWWASRRTMEETIHEALGIVHFMLGSRCRRSTRSPDQYPPPPIVVHMPLRQIPPAVWQRSTSPPVETAGAVVEAGTVVEVGFVEVVVAQPATARPSASPVAATATAWITLRASLAASLDIGDSHDVVEHPAYTHQIASPRVNTRRRSTPRHESEGVGRGGRIRTCTSSRTEDFKSSASAVSPRPRGSSGKKCGGGERIRTAA